MRQPLSRAALALCLLILGLSGSPACRHGGGDSKIDRLLTAEELYEQGRERLKPRRGFLFFKYVDTQEAVATFQQIIDNFPTSEYALQAELMIAEAYYNDEKYDEAAVYYDDFIRSHPTHGSVPQAIYQTGMCKFKRLPIKERDQTRTKEAAGYFELLINKFPESPFSEKARQRLLECKGQLAEHDFFVAEFYMKQEDYRGALNRCNSILANYPGAGCDARALYCVGVANYHLDEPRKARDAFERLVEEHPSDSKVGSARAYLARLQSLEERQDELGDFGDYTDLSLE